MLLPIEGAGPGWISNDKDKHNPLALFSTIPYVIFCPFPLQFLTDIFKKKEAFLPGPGQDTDLVLCESEMKLNMPAVSSKGSASMVEYWGRALASQILPDIDRGLGVTFSGLKDQLPLSAFGGPLPVFQVSYQWLSWGTMTHNQSSCDFLCGCLCRSKRIRGMGRTRLATMHYGR